MSFSQQIKKSNTDEWYTPVEAVEIIVPFLRAKAYKKILCPFDTDKSEFVKVLTREGFDVSYSHIQTGTDFFSIANLSDYDAVVSNPPFSKKEPILKRLFESKVPFAMILNLNGIFDSRKRWDLYSSNDFELLIPKGRIRFFNDDCDGSAPQFQAGYVCHDILDRQIVFTNDYYRQLEWDDWRNDE